MSAPSSSKKRKHAAVDAPTSPLSPNKSAKKPKSKPNVTSSHTHAVLSNEAGPLDQPFTRVRAAMTVSIPPVFASNPRRGVEEMLDTLLMKYSPALEGVLLAHSAHAFLAPAAVLIADSPFSTARITYTALVWRPRIGMRLRGAVSLCGPDHVGLILDRTFNCSVPRWGIDEGVWEYVQGQGQGDGWGRDGEGEGGWWRTRMTGEQLGGESGRVDFTVVGMTIANQMLSLTGSLHSDPLNPANLPSPDDPVPHSHSSKSFPSHSHSHSQLREHRSLSPDSEPGPAEPTGWGAGPSGWGARDEDAEGEDEEEEDDPMEILAQIRRDEIEKQQQAQRDEAMELDPEPAPGPEPEQQRFTGSASAEAAAAEAETEKQEKAKRKKEKKEKKKRKAELVAVAAVEPQVEEPRKKKRKKDKVKTEERVV